MFIYIAVILGYLKSFREILSLGSFSPTFSEAATKKDDQQPDRVLLKIQNESRSTDNTTMKTSSRLLV